MTEETQPTYETFALYGFSLSYPDNWDVSVPRKLDRFDGGILFQSPQADITFTLTWGLPELSNENDSPDLREGARKMRERLTRARGVKELRVLRESPIEINSHEAIANHVEVSINLGVFKSQLARYTARFAHLYCDKTERYFVIHGTPTGKTQELDSVFERIVKSFKCH